MQTAEDRTRGSVVTREEYMPTERSQPERLSSPNVVRVKQVVRQVNYVDQEHYRVTFEYFSVLRERGDFCDVKFAVDKTGGVLQAHKLVLASSSPYFESLFAKENLPDPVTIDGVDGGTLEQLIIFAYSSEIAINEKNVRRLLKAAQRLKFDGVKEACYRYFKNHIDISNCIQMWRFAERHKCQDLADAAARCIQLNFREISSRQDFLQLSVEQLLKLTVMGELIIEREEDVYLAVINWARHDPANRQCKLSEALKHIRFACMDNAFVMNVINSEPLIKDDIACLEVLCNALGPDANESWPSDRLAMLSDRPSLKLCEVCMYVPYVQVYCGSALLTFPAILLLFLSHLTAFVAHTVVCCLYPQFVRVHRHLAWYVTISTELISACTDVGDSTEWQCPWS